MEDTVKRNIWTILTLLVLLSLVAACGGATAPEPAAEDPAAEEPAASADVEVVKVGALYPLTGPDAGWAGDPYIKSHQLAIDEINAAGGVQVGDESYDIKLVQVDSNELKSIDDASSRALEAITVDNVDFLMGSIRSEGQRR